METKIENVYKFDKVLGEGSFGVVKKIIKKSTGELFAVKIMNKQTLNQEDLEALETEVEILQNIDHPNVVKLYEIYEDDQFFYMILELMTGGELFERIVEKDHYSEKEAANTIKPIIEALVYCHKMGIAHRDLKPENLLYSSPDKGAIIKISDFGLARYIDKDLMKTQCGTPGYVAPEIIKGEGYNEAIDWWSVGVILYILLCGFPPFYDENNDKLFEQIQKAQYDFPSPYWDNISKEAKDLIKKLLVIDPEYRLKGEKILQHPWMKNNIDTQLKDVTKKIYELSAAMKKLKKSVSAIRFVAKMQGMKSIITKKK